MQGLRKKLLVNYGLVVIVTVLLAELVLIISIKPYYYGQVSRTLLERATVAAEFYNKFLFDYPLRYQADYIMEDARKQPSIKVQVLDSQGRVVQDVDGFYEQDQINTPDVQKAQQGYQEVCEFKSETGESLMAVSIPLKYKDKPAGFLRYVTSTEQVRAEVNRIILLGLAIGLLILALSGLFSLLLARSIIKPVEELTSAARQIAAGDYSGRTICSGTDEIGQLVDSFNYMAGEIARSEQLKNEFISSISHELRTPLTSIKGWSETVLSGNLEDREETLLGLRYISEETDRLAELVEELLDFSRYQAGGTILSLEMVNLNQLVQEVIRQFKPVAAEKGIKLELNLTRSRAQLQGDYNRLKQVVLNLLINAFKFTPAGGKIIITTEVQAENIILEVRDNGVGIAPEDLPRLTEKFYKGQSRQPGSGLGLSICAEIIKLHHGDLHITSPSHQGTIVTVRL